MSPSRVTRIVRSISALLLLGGLSACGGGGGSSSPPPPPPPPTFGPNFSEIQAAVFTPTCATAGCHAGAAAPQDLRLDAANSFANLVGVASTEDPAFLRVNPGDPDASYLIRKLEGTASVGAQMPFGRTPLSTAAIATIRQWISDGAIDDRVPAPTPVRITSVTPQPGRVLASTPPEFVIEFDRDPDASTINAITILLTGSGGDNTFGDANDVSVAATSITVPAANTRSAVFDLTGVDLDDDQYQLSVLGDGPNVVLDMDANALDGEFDGTLPSGDGMAGGDFAAVYEVRTQPPAGTTLDEIQAAVFGMTCAAAGCHSEPLSPIVPPGLVLSSADASFASLVGVASFQQPQLLRVDPNNPDDSYLIQKLEGTAAIGAQMPFGGTPLDQATIDNIRAWIENGAER